MKSHRDHRRPVWARGSIVTRTLTGGEKRYDTVIRIHGRQRWKTFPKKRQAEAFLDLHSTDIREGTYRELKKATFAEYVERWKAKVGRVAGSRL